MKKYKVKYFDAEKSRRGKGGVWVRSFNDRAEAEEFASKNRVYGSPCKVDEVNE